LNIAMAIHKGIWRTVIEKRIQPMTINRKNIKIELFVKLLLLLLLRYYYPLKLNSF